MRGNPRRSIRQVWLAVALVACASGLAAGQVPSEPADVLPAELEEIARKVLELRRAAEELLAPLSSEERLRVEARVERLAAAREPATTTTAAARPAPEPPAQVVPAPEPPPRPTPPTTTTTATTATTTSPNDAPRLETAPRTSPTPCRGLAVFDFDGDGMVTAIDRAWRHLYLWRDDGDGTAGEAEVTSLFELGVRALDTAQRTYTTASGFVGDLEIGDGVELEIPARRRGEGFERGEIVVNNDGLRRAGEPTIRAGDGAELAGYQPLRRGYRLSAREGGELVLPCDG